MRALPGIFTAPQRSLLPGEADKLAYGKQPASQRATVDGSL